MEELKRRYRDMCLRQAFTVTVAVIFALVVLLSLGVVAGCTAAQNWLLPESNTVLLTVHGKTADGTERDFSARLSVEDGEPVSLLGLAETGKNADGKNQGNLLSPETMSVTALKVENSFAMLSPKRKLAYQMCGAAVVVVPVLLSVGAVLFCGYFFYRHKLGQPIDILSHAAAQIADRDLDFEVPVPSGDELGKLCASFEEMRQALLDNNRELWNMLEERKRLQASVAHDLRNPIAIIMGYAEYLQLHLQEGDLTLPMVGKVSGNLCQASQRLQQYTESLRTVAQLEDIEVHKEPVPAGKLFQDIQEDLRLMAAEGGKTLCVVWGSDGAAAVNGGAADAVLQVDAGLLYRVLENVLNNALRFAEKTIEMEIALAEEGRRLVVTISDDGPGFPEEVLRSRNRLQMPSAGEGSEHFGMGLSICRILCQKHGGRLELGNRQPHGASVKIIFTV